MAYRRKFAYRITAGGIPQVGGTTTADTMDAAVRSLMGPNELTIERLPSVVRPCDNAVIPQAKWRYKGKEATVFVWAPPEYFVD
jgi:hypothetical protein